MIMHLIINSVPRMANLFVQFQIYQKIYYNINVYYIWMWIETPPNVNVFFIWSVKDFILVI